MTPQVKPWISPEEYFEFEKTSEERHEYHDGEMFAMSGGTFPHSVIGFNLGREVGNRLKDGCTVTGFDARVHIESRGLYTYPDVVIVCGPAKISKPGDSLLNPKVIFEVLSKSTERYDRGAKFESYRKIVSLEEYILVSQWDFAIDQFRRNEAGRWELTEIRGEDNVLEIPSVQITIPLKPIYKGVDFTLANEE